MSYVVIIDGRQINQGLMFLQDDSEFGQMKLFSTVLEAMSALDGHVLEKLPWRVYTYDYLFNRLFGAP